MSRRVTVPCVALLVLGTVLQAQESLPILDMHLHANAADGNGPPPLAICVPLLAHLPPWDPKEPWPGVFMRHAKEPPCPDPVWSSETDEGLMNESIAAMREHNVYGVLSGVPERVRKWKKAAPDLFWGGLGMDLGLQSTLSPEAIEPLFASGEFAVLGEIANQYSGIGPDDPRMEPYWALAERLDVPVAIHLGSGPAGAPYLGFPKMRIRDGSALLLEDVLVAHPTLRVSLMHYGHQQLDDTVALMEHHPQVYADLGGIQWYYPREYFWRQLKTLIDAGFGKRIMFGSDQMIWPGLIEESIAVVEDAPFLSEQQKRDIFYNNAARFLRLSDEEIARHHRGRAEH